MARDSTTKPSPRRRLAIGAERHIGSSEMCGLLGIHISTLMRHIKADKVPKPVRIGAVWRWRESEISAWLAAGGSKPQGQRGDA